MAARYPLVLLNGELVELPAGDIITFDDLAWTNYTPTFAPETGAFTSATPTGRRKVLGKTVLFQMDLLITTNGIAGGTYVTASLPFAAIAGKWFTFPAGEWAVTGNICGARLNPGFSTSLIIINNPGGVYPGGDGRRIVVTGGYEAA